ncbi:MAG TPA: peptidoglycan DD-metalloendopeptidase family protein [Bacillota bacterium]|nr:peptidoglycan DD-metalloendopeptidase family protein [Bacillota bacterium]
MKKESAFSDTMAGLVSEFDRSHEEFAQKTEAVVSKGNRRLRFLRVMADRKRVLLLKYFAGIVAVTVGVLTLFNYVTGYEYSYNGKVLGLVKGQKEVTQVLEIASDQLTDHYNAKITIGEKEDIQFRKVVTINRDVDDMEEVLKRLTYMKDINASGYGIYVNEKRMAALATKKEAKKVLRETLAKFSRKKDGVKYEEVKFAEKVKIKTVDTKLGNIQKIAAVQGKMFADEDSPMLHVTTVEKAVYKEKVHYETKKKDNPDAYIGENSTTVKGKDGENEVVARITRINGKEIKRDILKTKELTKPVTKVVLVGTKKIPPTMGDGKYCNPCPAGYVSSGFGYRWGRLHRGVDLACSSGNSIYAADGGTVVSAGYRNSYGNVVEINHRNGVVTRYAHCSSILVHAGQKVYEGKLIARVGSTGNSTGPHLHFEMQINGRFVNPLKYI